MTQREALLIEALRRADRALENAYNPKVGVMDPTTEVAADMRFIKTVLTTFEPEEDRQ